MPPSAAGSVPSACALRRCAARPRRRRRACVNCPCAGGLGRWNALRGSPRPGGTCAAASSSIATALGSCRRPSTCSRSTDRRWTQFDAATRAGYRSLSLVAANPHLRRLLRQHELAHRQYPLEGTWATRLLRRNLQEYARAERIFVASRYTWESFVEEGVPERLLSLFPLTPDPRFTRGQASVGVSTFDVVFVGRLCVTKGVPLLVDAIARLAHDDLRLVLVGGWSSRGMRRFLEQARARDARITIGPGDPLPRLRDAALLAHPAYEDGFAYAPAEALACGVPVLVSEDTGMKELIEPGVSGAVLPTGDLNALTEAIDAAYKREILR